MTSRFLPLCLALIALFALSAQADEIKLKNGEVIKDCKVRSKRGGKWTVELLDGSRRRLKESEVESHVEKPTIADKILDKFKKLDQKKDVEGMLELAREAHDAGAIAATKTICRKITRADKKNVEAHELMGETLCDDGKWRGGKSLERYQQKNREKDLKARGYKKIKGEWVDPETAANMAAGLVKVGDEWYTKQDAANLEKGMIWCEGAWYAAADKDKLDSGMRKYKGKWLKITEINRKIKDAGEAWALQSKHFIVIGPQSHATLTKLLGFLEHMWAPMTQVFGGAPSCVKPEDKLTVIVAKDNLGYRQMHANHPGDDRVAHYSSAMGGYYSPKSGAVLVYYYSVDYLIQWVQHSIGHSFLSRTIGYDKAASPLYEAFGAFQGFFEGKFVAYNEMWFNGIQDWKAADPVQAFESFDISVREDNATRNEGRFNRMAIVIHYLRETHPDTVNDLVQMMRDGKASKPAVLKALGAIFDEKGKAKFQDWLDVWIRAYKRPI